MIHSSLSYFILLLASFEVLKPWLKPSAFLPQSLFITLIFLFWLSHISIPIVALRSSMPHQSQHSTVSCSSQGDFYISVQIWGHDSPSSSSCFLTSTGTGNWTGLPCIRRCFLLWRIHPWGALTQSGSASAVWRQALPPRSHAALKPSALPN